MDAPTKPHPITATFLGFIIIHFSFLFHTRGRFPLCSIVTQPRVFYFFQILPWYHELVCCIYNKINFLVS